MKFDVLTLFPSMYDGILKESIISRATRVFPNPVGNTQEAHPPVFNHRLIPSFCLSVLFINNYHRNKLSILGVVSSTSGTYLIFLTHLS